MLQQKTRKNIEEKKENKGKKRKQKKQKKNLRRNLTLVVGENSSVKHAFSVSTTATRTTRRIALPHLRPSLSLCPALSVSFSRGELSLPRVSLYPGSAR